MHARPDERAQLRALIEAFFTRFFESDTTLERTDATRSFMWLVAVLAAPGLLLSFFCQFSWELLARHRDGLEAFRLSARFDASLYLTLTFVAVAVIAAARWQSLVIDRRDALILGTLPLRPRTIVSAKLAALAGYTALVAVGMHVASSVVYGVSLGGLERPTNILRTFAGHLVAGVGLTVFVMTTVAAAQAVGLALLGPRRFARPAVLMQMALIGAVLVVFVVMPGKGAAAFSTFSPAGVIGPSWIQWLPPLWFVGLFETVAGTAGPDMQAFGATAVVAVLSSAAALAVAAPIAGWRVLRTTLDAAGTKREPASRLAAAILTRVLARTGAVRGATQFTLSTIGRVPAPRLVLALLSGIGLMSLVPVILAGSLWDAGRPDATTTVLALPFVLLFFFLLGLRLAIKSPVELAGRWLFEQTDVSPLAGRTAARRILFALGIVPPVVLTAVLWALFWDPAVAAGRTVAAFFGGLLVLEVMLYGYVGVPCSRPAIGEAFKGRTLGLAVGFEVFCFETAAAQAGWQDDVGAVLLQAAFFAVAALVVHLASQRAAEFNAVVDEHLDPRLNLEVVGPLVHTEGRGAGGPSQAG